METLQEQHLTEGIEALRQYETAKLAGAIDQVVATSGKLHFKGTAKKFKSKVMEGAQIVFGGREATLQFLNKNKYYGKGLKIVNEYLEENPEIVEEMALRIETKTGISLEDNGFTGTLYKKMSKALVAQGLVGENGALTSLADTIVGNLDSILDSYAGSLKKSPGFMKRKQKKVMDFIARSSITTEGIQNAYKESGFKGEKGVIKYLFDNALASSGPELDGLLAQLKMFGIEHGETSHTIIASYQANGFLGRRGLVEKIAEMGLKVPGSDKFVYMGLLNLALDSKKKKIKAAMKAQSPKGSDTTDIDKVVDKQYSDIITKMASTGAPKEISQEKILEVYNANGLFGDSGLFSYITSNVKEIYADAVAASLVEENDVAKVSKAFSTFSKAKALKDLAKNSSYEKYAIAVARKSEELGITSLELLSNEAYVKEKKACILEGYDHLDVYFAKMTQATDTLPLLDQAIDYLESGKLKTDELFESIKELLNPRSQINQALVDLAEPLITRNTVHKVQDYLRLTRGLVQNYLDAKKDESALYEAI